MAMIIVFPAPDKKGGAVLLEQILDPAPEGFRKHIFLSISLDFIYKDRLRNILQSESYKMQE